MARKREFHLFTLNKLDYLRICFLVYVYVLQYAAAVASGFNLDSMPTNFTNLLYDN